MILTLGISMMIGFIIAVYLGFKEQYNANEGTLALLVLETFFISLGLIIYGIYQIVH